MKRTPARLLPDHDITEFKTIFEWTECDICHDEVRRAPMWKIFIDYINHPLLCRTFHICKDCLPTIEDVIEFRDEKSNTKFIRPSPPPPWPPMSRSGESRPVTLTEGKTRGGMGG